MDELLEICGHFGLQTTELFRDILDVNEVRNLRDLINKSTDPAFKKALKEAIEEEHLNEKSSALQDMLEAGDTMLKLSTDPAFKKALKEAIEEEEHSNKNNSALQDMLEAAHPGEILDILQQQGLSVAKFFPRFRVENLLRAKDLDNANGKFTVFLKIARGVKEEEKIILKRLLNITSEVIEKRGNANKDKLGKGLEASHAREATQRNMKTKGRQTKQPKRSTNAWQQSAEFKVLKQLGIAKFYPEKITLQDVQKRSKNSVKCQQDVPWFVLNGIISLDFTARNGSFISDLNATCETDTASDVGEDFLDELFGAKNIEHEPLVHPSDVLVATLLCCSMDLRQIICEKLFKCRLSIPLTLHDLIKKETTFLSWSLRNIICEFVKLASDEAIEVSVVDQPMHYVSFVRVGELKTSKSKFANDIINKLCGQDHCTFLHREEAGGLIPKVLTDRLLEIAWYFPSKERERNVIKRPVGIINLRGSAASAAPQANFVFQLSDLVVLMLDIKDLLKYEQEPDALNKLVDESASVYLIIFNDDSKAECQIKEALTILKVLEQRSPGKIRRDNIILELRRNKHDSKKTIIDTICKLTESVSPKALNESFPIASNFFTFSEELHPYCAKGKQLALNVIREMENACLSEVKESQLPLQGVCWTKWALLSKKEKRSKLSSNSNGICNDQLMAKIKQDKDNLRREQLRNYNQLSNLANIFLMQMIDISKESESMTCNFYMKWLKLFLDEKCRQILPKLHQEYSSTWRCIQDSKEKGKGNTSLIESKKRELKAKEVQIAASSLGLEHFIRELGQMYELFSALPKEINPLLLKQKEILPSIIAQLIINGHTLEIMDGDASFVPLTWIKAIFNKLKELIGDKKVFVLSMLGLQSSGKTTLLNAMFGFQFAVSAGRCTRGVFAQLVPVGKSETNRTYDYILLVDVEGLRAPELGTSTYQHDHELAMLVVGLGDATILNIKGEFQAEMQDMLPIVVHAFLRLHSIKLQPSCLLIHQNVNAVNASQKMMYVQQKLQNALDSMTMAAAEQEGIENIDSFQDVIEFDPVKHVWYFSDLWQGNPPMAPVNPGYSRDVLTVKRFILDDLLKNDEKGTNITGLINRLNDLWEGILQEDFAFSFKNSIEIRAFTSLEQFQSTINWNAKREASRLITIARQKILGWEEKHLKTDFAALINQLTLDLKSHFAKSERKIEEFFRKSQYSLIFEQWKQRTLIAFQTMLFDQTKQLEHECNNFAKERKFQLRLNQTTASYKFRPPSKTVWSALSKRLVMSWRTMMLRKLRASMSSCSKNFQAALSNVRSVDHPVATRLQITKTNWKPHPYREYEKIFPDWIIPRDASMVTSLFWKWYLANYAEDLVRVHELQMPDIPEEWKNIDMEEAIASLSRA